jgi:tetratricopeptide (TPR) repeat protein
MKKLILIMAISALAATAYAADHNPRQMLAEGQVNEALTALKAATQSAPKDAEAFHQLAHAYYVLERWDDAIAAEQQAVNLAPNNSEYHLILGCAYGEKADTISKFAFFTAVHLAHVTRAEFEKSVELDGKNIEARRDLAEYYAQAPGSVFLGLGGSKDKARAQADKIKDIDLVSYHWIRARAAEEDKKYDVAEAEFRAAIAASSSPAKDWLELASYYRHRKKYPEMEEALNKAVSLDNKQPSNVLFDASSQLLRAGRNIPLATSLARKYIAAEKHAEDAPVFQAHFLLGQLLEKQGDKKGAADEYNASLAQAADYKRAQDALKNLK